MRKINKVVSTVWYNKENYHTLRNVFPDSKFVYVDFYDKEKAKKEMEDADVAIVLGDVDPYMLESKTLKWIACDHAGLNGSARDDVFASGKIVTGAAGRSAPVLAEHVVYFMLQSCYHTKALLRAQENGDTTIEGSNKWKGLYGRSVGIIGMGNNGKMVADRLRAMGMKIYGFDKYPIKGYDFLEAKYCGTQGDTIDPLLEKCDFIVITCLLTDETFHMFNKETFAKMKKDAFLVNLARGAIVDTEALTEAIQNGVIYGAGLDVVEEEPLPKDHPLRHLESVYITPHSTPQVPNRSGRTIEIIRENAKRFINEEPMINQLKEEDRFAVGEAKSGFARLTSSNLSKEQIEKMPLEKFLGKKDWKDQSEWDQVD